MNSFRRNDIPSYRRNSPIYSRQKNDPYQNRARKGLQVQDTEKQSRTYYRDFGDYPDDYKQRPLVAPIIRRNNPYYESNRQYNTARPNDLPHKLYSASHIHKRPWESVKLTPDRYYVGRSETFRNIQKNKRPLNLESEFENEYRIGKDSQKRDREDRYKRVRELQILEERFREERELLEKKLELAMIEDKRCYLMETGGNSSSPPFFEEDRLSNSLESRSKQNKKENNVPSMKEYEEILREKERLMQMQKVEIKRYKEQLELKERGKSFLSVSDQGSKKAENENSNLFKMNSRMQYNRNSKRKRSGKERKRREINEMRGIKGSERKIQENQEIQYRHLKGEFKLKISRSRGNKDDWCIANSDNKEQ